MEPRPGVDGSPGHRRPRHRRLYPCDPALERTFGRLPGPGIVAGRPEPELGMSRESIDFSMLGIFRTEAESQTQALTSSLLELEQDPAATDALEACMRAAHSLK